MVKRRLAVLAALSGGALLACQVIAGIERTDKASQAPSEADAASSDDAGPPDPCAHAVPPGPPARDDNPAGTIAPIYFAIREMNLGKRPDGGDAPAGFDLDESCTCDTRPFTAFDGGSSCVPSKSAICDPDGGLDNQMFLALEPLTAGIGDIDKAAGLNGKFADGSLGFLLYLKDYNGERNDLQVRVGGILASGVYDNSGCGGDASPYFSVPPHYPPGWCGKDKWSVLGSSVLEGTEVPAVLGNGYVTDGRLVYTVPSAQVFFGTAPIELGSVKVSARLSRVGEKWHLDDGVLAGRANVSDTLAALGLLRYDNTFYLCESQLLFESLKSALCESADLANAPAFDFTGVPCTSISLAFSFRAEQAGSAPPLPDSGLVDPTNPCRFEAGAPIYQCP